MRPDQTQGARFLFSDEGHNLLVSSVVAAGGRIYSDVFTPYGPFTVWSALIAARIGGNTPVTYEVLNLLLNTLALAMVFALIRKYTSPLWAMLLTLIPAVPAMLAPGSLLGGGVESPYMALERVVFAALLLMWDAPDRRSWRRSLLIGVVAGSCQWIRFGNVILAVIGVFAADLLAYRKGGDRKMLIRKMAGVAVGVVAVEMALVAWAGITLPWPVARDLLWPSYSLPSYDWVTRDLRWPAASVSLLAAQYGGAVAGLVIGSVILWRSRRSPGAPLVAFLLCAYLAGAAGLFRHAWHFRQYGWWLAVAGSLAAASSTVRVRVGVLGMSAWVFVAMMRGLAEPPSPGAWVQTPASGAVYLSAEEAENVRALNALAATIEGRGQRIVVGPMASGWYALFSHQPPTRHTWFLSGLVRPWERQSVAHALTSSGAVVVCGDNRTLAALKLPREIELELAATLSQHRAISRGCEAYFRE